MHYHTKSGPNLTPHDVALAYAEQDIPVFPCGNKEKEPLTATKKDSSGNKIPKSGGLYQATTDRETINNWWTQHPDALVAIRTGQASGYAVVDVDYDPEK